MNKVFNPLCNSPREVDSKDMPGPGNYEYKNMAIGTEARRFSFLRRTRNSMGKSISFGITASDTVITVQPGLFSLPTI